jgi:hypothetical protein
MGRQSPRHSVAVEKLHAIADDCRFSRSTIMECRAMAEIAEARAPLALRTEAMDPRITVIVGDIDFAIRRDGGARRMVEGAIYCGTCRSPTRSSTSPRW